MALMVPSPGRIVHYTLSESNVQEIAKQRVAHPTGNPPQPDEVFPMLIVKVWAEPREATTDTAVQGQVFLDGSDSFWVSSGHQGDGSGQWHEPPRV